METHEIWLRNRVDVINREITLTLNQKYPWQDVHRLVTELKEHTKVLAKRYRKPLTLTDIAKEVRSNDLLMQQMREPNVMIDEFKPGELP